MSPGTASPGLTGHHVAPDPRLPISPGASCRAEPLAGHRDAGGLGLYRLAAGLPEGSKDMEADRSVLLEAGFDELAGVSWTKGCYMGQELTARTKYRGLVKRRLVPVAIEGPLPPPGTPVLRDGVDVGTMRSGRDGTASGLRRLRPAMRLAQRKTLMLCGDGDALVASIPDWMRLPRRHSSALAVRVAALHTAISNPIAALPASSVHRRVRGFSRRVGGQRRPAHQQQQQQRRQAW